MFQLIPSVGTVRQKQEPQKMLNFEFNDPQKNSEGTSTEMLVTIALVLLRVIPLV